MKQANKVLFLCIIQSLLGQHEWEVAYQASQTADDI